MGEKSWWTTPTRGSKIASGILLLIVFSIVFMPKREDNSKEAGVSAAPAAEKKSAASISEYKFVKETIGCKDWATWTQLGKLVAQGDKEAFGKVLIPALALDTCRRFKAGDRTFLHDTAIFSGSTCMRPKGETACYWVSIETADPA